MNTKWCTCRNLFLLSFCTLLVSSPALCATAIPFTVTMSENVTVTGTPRIVLNVDGNARYATYSSGSGTSSLTFTYSATAGDVDLDGIGISSTTVDLNGGTMTDLNGNSASLTFAAPANMANIKVNYPSLSFDLIFDSDGRYSLNGTVYNDLTSLLTAAGGTFTRASTARYFDSAGVMQSAASGAPRFDYDPVTHVAKGILIEETRTNLFTRSSEIDDSAWTKAGGGANVTVTANATTSPDGTANADLVESTGISNSFISIRAPFSAGNTVTWSIYAKAGTSSRLIFECSDNSTYITTTFDISTLSVTPGSGVTASIQSVGNGWYRLVTTRTFVQSSATAFVGTFYIDAYGTAPAGRNIYIWGAQAEIGFFATSYIPTAATTVTRAADNLTVPVGAWYNASTTTISGNYSSFAPNAYSTRIASLNDGTSSNVFQLADSSGGIILAQKAIGGSILNSSGPTYVPNTSYKIAGTMDSVSGPLAVNNTLYSNTNAGLPPGITRIQVGNQNGGNFLNGWISQLKYYPSRVSNAQLQLLTQ